MFGVLGRVGSNADEDTHHPGAFGDAKRRKDELTQAKRTVAAIRAEPFGYNRNMNENEGTQGNLENLDSPSRKRNVHTVARRTTGNCERLAFEYK